MPRKVVQNLQIQNHELMRAHTKVFIRKQIPKLSKEQIELLESSIEASDGSYVVLVVKVIENLKRSYVMKKIMSGEWNIEDIPILERETLDPVKWQTLQETRIPKNETKERRKGINRCPKCKSWYTTYALVQTRSGDEGMTSKCYCEDCEHHWKFG